ncbi:MAG: hypothetical protein ACM3NV_07480, partial [Syntrophothermus sp.]
FGEDFARVNPLVLVAPAPVALGLLAQNLTIETDSCNVAQYRTLPTGVARSSATTAGGRAGASSFRVPAHQRTTVLVLHGAGGSPQVTLRGPGGRVVDATGIAPSIGADQLVLHVPSEDATEIQLRGRTAGAWKIEPAPGSPPITKVGLSHELPPPVVTGKVSGHGAHRVLAYRTRLPAGTRVTFLEHGAHGSTVIGSTRRSRGRIAFVPSTAKAGKRAITATPVSAAGTPEPSVKVTTYTARPPRPGRPGHLRIRRSRGALHVSFTPAPLASLHFVTVSLSDGRRLLFVLRGQRHSVVVRGVRRRAEVRSVRVRGEGFGRMGPAATGR